MARILISGRGSFGDLFPIYAIAEKLRERGHDIAVDVPPSNHNPFTSTAPSAPATGPSATKVAGARREGARREGATSPYRDLVRHLSGGDLEADVARLEAEAREADLVIGNQLAYAAAILCRRLQKPWVFCAASPVTLPSWHDPPRLPYVHAVQSLAPDNLLLQRSCLVMARAVSRMIMRPQSRLLRRLGLDDRRHPRFEGMHSDRLNLLLVSPMLVEPAADWPQPTFVSGFTWYEPTFLREQEKTQRLLAFLESGSPPVVFALGADNRRSPGAFFLEGIRACERLGLRAIVVAAQRFHADLPRSGSTMATTYLPYADVIPKAAAVVHSGGIGTIGWCLRYGIPSLLRPTGLDQFDNVWRTCRKGYAAEIPARHFRAAAIAEALARLLDDGSLRHRLSRCSEIVSREDGASAAASNIEKLLR